MMRAACEHEWVWINNTEKECERCGLPEDPLGVIFDLRAKIALLEKQVEPNNETPVVAITGCNAMCEA